MSNNKIFISHSSKDIKIVESFVQHVLRLGLDIPTERIFCTSMEGHGVKSGEYIPDRLKSEICIASIALLFISKNYKASEVCLNEVGAAWATLDKTNIIPILLPDVDFNEIGFLNINRLGLKLINISDILKLINDKKDELNPSFDLQLLHKQINLFLSETNIKDNKQTNSTPEYVDEWTECFRNNLEPFDDIIRRAIPAYNDGIYEIKDIQIQNKILTDLSKASFLHHLWCKQAEGDFYVQQLRKLPSGNWLISVFNWEVKISSMWISKYIENQYEFILIHSKALEPYKIDSDIGGEAYQVGILKDGTIISENERTNGYAVINGETIDLSHYEVEPRLRDRESHWVFFVSYYHKAGFNPDETIDFCKKLDDGTIQVNEKTIINFLRSLRNHPTVSRWL